MFDAVVESSVVGVRKPDERFYLLACDALDIAPTEAVFLDDLGVNLKPARALGMATIKVTDTAERPGRARSSPRHHAALTRPEPERRSRSSGEGPAQEVLLLELVQRRAPRGRAGRLGPAHVGQGEAVPESRCRRPWAKDHAPMFSGSSWTHTTWSASG